MSFFNELLEKYNEIWEKVKYSIKKQFHSESTYNEKYLNAKIKSYNGKINANSYNNKIPKEGSHCICLSVILINSIFRTGNNYRIQVFLEGYKHVVKEKRDAWVYHWRHRNFFWWFWLRRFWWKNSNEENSDEENFDEQS